MILMFVFARLFNENVFRQDPIAFKAPVKKSDCTRKTHLYFDSVEWLRDAPANTKHGPNAGLMLVWRRRRQANVKPALVQRFMYAPMISICLQPRRLDGA